MKTEPTGALKILDETRLNPIHEIPRHKAELAAKIAFQEGQSNPKIKQLEWDFYGTYYSAKTPVASYLITQEGEFIENYDDCELWVNASLILRGTHEEAKAAAQAGFEKRVMECLDL